MSAKETGAINVRRMTSTDDLDGVIALMTKITKGEIRITYRDLVANYPGGPFDLSFVAEVDGRMVGFILARLEFVYIPFVEVCLIDAVGVDPEHQGRRIGSALVQKLIERCHLEDVDTIRALVADGDEPLRRFIEYLGFRRSNIVNYDKTTY
ncbi:MAG TPA: GNAT family N-acetyltransferase [Dehalococcoidia bacterium]|nr:GNAT family N-acetyltransferase [Dehalococcoidia bacterium]